MRQHWPAWALGVATLAFLGRAERVNDSPVRFDVPQRSESGLSSLAFESNVGQFASPVRFAARGSGYALWLTDHGAQLALRGLAPEDRELVLGLSSTPLGALPVPSRPLVGRANYFRGNDPARWVTGAQRFEQVTYPGVKPGIDLVFHGEEGRLEYDFVVAEGASVDDATLELSGAEGLSLDGNGALLIQTTLGVLKQLPPVVYQEEKGGGRRQVAGGYRIVGASRVAFAVGEYDTTRALFVDPVLLYGSYLGGSSFDQANAVTLDATENVYVAGFTTSTDFPTHDARQSVLGGSLDAFIAKFDPSGKTLLYATYLGGASEDSATAIAIDATGNAYVAGNTQSADFPVTRNPYQSFNDGAGNAFVTKIDPDGRQLAYSTFFGGSGFDAATALKLDGGGHVFVAGYTQSPDFPTEKPFQSTLMGPQNAFVAELAPTGALCSQLGAIAPSCSPSLVAGTYLGGSSNDAANALLLDAEGNVWMAGYTQSPNFPTVNAYQKRLTGAQNAFVAKFAPGLKSLAAYTYFGGSGQDAANALAIDEGGNIYLAGSTSSPDFPVAHALQASLHGNEDAFVTKFSPDLSSLIYSSYLGGADTDLASALGVLPSGGVFLVGQTRSIDFPIVGAAQATNRAAGTPEGSAFLAVLPASGHFVQGSSYLGGQGGASALSLAVTSVSTAWVVGAAGKGLSVPGGLVPTFTADGPAAKNAFLVQISPDAAKASDGGSQDAASDGESGDGSAPSSDGAGVGVVPPPLPGAMGGSGCSCRVGRPKGPSGLTWTLSLGAVLLGAAARRRRAT
jgi:MYXO-CTERM domain-containing protein